MTDSINIWIAMLAAFATTASPGPSTIAIAGASMSGGRRMGLATAAGITLGSWTWSIMAAFGLGAVMVTNAWIFETMRYAGAAYLFYLAFRALFAAWKGAPIELPASSASQSLRRAFMRGLMIHITNPKVILLFGSIYAVAWSHDASVDLLLLLVIVIGAQSMVIFLAYVFIFSSAPIIRAYAALSRTFNTIIGFLFGVMAFKLLDVEISN